MSGPTMSAVLSEWAEALGLLPTGLPDATESWGALELPCGTHDEEDSSQSQFARGKKPQTNL